MKDKEYALALEGGGTRGAYQVGVWKALKEMGIKIKAISGTSIGSLNGALILQDDLEGMIKLYENIEIKNIMKINEEVDQNKNLFNIKNVKKLAADYLENKGIDNTPLRDTINQYVDIDKIYNSDIDFGLVTYSIKNKMPVQLFKQDIPKEKMVDYLLASSCFPIFKAQKIDEIEFWDGAFYDTTPINMLIEKGYKNIIVADINGAGFRRKLIDKNVYLKIISPKENLGGSFEFNHDKIKNNITLGYLDTMRSFNKMQGHMYYFPTEEFNKMLEEFNLQTIYGLENAAKIYRMNKYKTYKFEEFIQELSQKHNEAKEKYTNLRNKLHIKFIPEFKGKVKAIFNGGMGICFVMDMYLDKPMSKKFDYLKIFTQDYLTSVEALIELENFMS